MGGDIEDRFRITVGAVYILDDSSGLVYDDPGLLRHMQNADEELSEEEIAEYLEEHDIGQPMHIESGWCPTAP